MIVSPEAPGSAGAQPSVTAPWATEDVVNAVAAGTGSLVMAYCSVTTSDTLFDGSNATNLSGVSAVIVIGPV